MLKFSLLDISRGPQIEFCTTGPLSRDWSGNSRFECRISNYSDYVRVLVVEDNKIEYNESSDALSFGCKAQISDRSLASCTVSISSSAHYSKRQYKLCAGYNGTHATQLQCSKEITVVPGKVHSEGIIPVALCQNYLLHTLSTVDSPFSFNMQMYDR